MKKIVDIMSMRHTAWIDMENKNDTGFFAGLFSVAMIYTVAWGIYQWGYSNGQSSEKCNRRHSYHMDSALPAFASSGIKK